MPATAPDGELDSRKIRRVDPGVLRQAPDESAFVRYPQSWYLLGSAKQLARGPLSRQVLGLDLVAFRTESGRVVVMNSRCSHLGADLSRGKVVGDCIECPFHGWRYSPDGRCSRIPNMTSIPERARQTVYPVVERHGLLFFFNARIPLFPLPFLIDDTPADFVAAKPVSFVADCSWYMVSAHGYDSQHFATVHSRKLHGPLQVDCPAPFARRSRYRADVLGAAYYDRLLRRFAGSTVDISITTWGGTIVTISGAFKRAISRFMICLTPLSDGKTRCDVIAFAPRANTVAGRLFAQTVGLWIRRLFTGAYLIAETESLGSPRYNPLSLVHADSEMIDYFCWAAELSGPSENPSHGTA